MKYWLTGLLLIWRFSTIGQTPGLSVSLRMDSLKAKNLVYKIEMKLCEPLEKSAGGDAFSNDTSEINFSSLRAAQLSCDEYISTNSTFVFGEETKPVNRFEYDRNMFAWEHIIVFKISHPNAKQPGMYVVMPIMYKSFITHIELNDVWFQPGKVIFLNNYNASYQGLYLNTLLSLKKQPAKPLKNFSLKGIL